MPQGSNRGLSLQEKPCHWATGSPSHERHWGTASKPASHRDARVIGDTEGWEEFGRGHEAAQLVLAAWLAQELGSPKIQRPRPLSSGQMWHGRLAAQRLGYLRPKHLVRFMWIEDLVLVMSHSSSQQLEHPSPFLAAGAEHVAGPPPP